MQTALVKYVETSLALCNSEYTVQNAAQHPNKTHSTHGCITNNTADLPASDHVVGQDGLPCSTSAR